MEAEETLGAAELGSRESESNSTLFVKAYTLIHH